MILKRISILNYKNLEEVELGFSAKLNCFFGHELPLEYLSAMECGFPQA